DDHRVQIGRVDHALQRAEGAGPEVQQHPPEPPVVVLVLDQIARGGTSGACEAAAAADDVDPHASTAGSDAVVSRVGPRKRRESRAKFSLPVPKAVWEKTCRGGRCVSRSCSVACSWL